MSNDNQIERFLPSLRQETGSQMLALAFKRCRHFDILALKQDLQNQQQLSLIFALQGAYILQSEILRILMKDDSHFH